MMRIIYSSSIVVGECNFETKLGFRSAAKLGEGLATGQYEGFNVVMIDHPFRLKCIKIGHCDENSLTVNEMPQPCASPVAYLSDEPGNCNNFWL